MKRYSICLVVLLVGAVLAGCARFQSKPISAAHRAEAFDHRSLADPGLRAFLETHDMVSMWPRESWDLNALTLVAFYYHPDMELARAKWRVATAGIITASQRPNPNLSFTPRFNSTSIGTGMTPWILGGVLDIPIETMGKRKHRVAQAEHLDQMARFELASAAWLARSRVRSSLLAVHAAWQTAELAQLQTETLGEMSRLVEFQWEAGAVSPIEVSTARVAFQNAQLSLKDAQRQSVDARVQLATALGVTVQAIADIQLFPDDLSSYPTHLVSGEIRRQAVMNRADVLAALAEYAASESALQIQIAKQYPDIHLRPGYELDQVKNKWQVGMSIDLPLLNRNQGPIAEALAKRDEAAAKFDAVQAKAIGEIDRATAVYSAAVDQAAMAEIILAGVRKRTVGMTRMYEAGDVDKLTAITAQAESQNSALAQLRARVQAQQALAAIENAIQSLLLMPAKTDLLETTAHHSDPPQQP